MSFPRASFSLIAMLGFVFAFSEAVARCELPPIRSSVNAWQIENSSSQYVATSDVPGFPDVRLAMEGWGTPILTDWIQPDRYDDNIGLLQYFAGYIDGNYEQPVIKNAVIWMPDGRVLGEQLISYACNGVLWSWEDDGTYLQRGNWSPSAIRWPEIPRAVVIAYCSQENGWGVGVSMSRLRAASDAISTCAVDSSRDACCRVVADNEGNECVSIAVRPDGRVFSGHGADDYVSSQSSLALCNTQGCEVVTTACQHSR